MVASDRVCGPSMKSLVDKPANSVPHSPDTRPHPRLIDPQQRWPVVMAPLPVSNRLRAVFTAGFGTALVLHTTQAFALAPVAARVDSHASASFQQTGSTRPQSNLPPAARAQGFKPGPRTPAAAAAEIVGPSGRVQSPVAVVPLRKVPNITGLQIGRARERLKMVQLVLGKVDTAGPVQIDTITGQDPLPDSSAPEHSAVDVQVGQPPGLVPVPGFVDVTGSSGSAVITPPLTTNPRPGLQWPPPPWSIVAATGALLLVGGGLAVRARAAGDRPPTDLKRRLTPSAPVPAVSHMAPAPNPELQYKVRMDGPQPSANGGPRSLALPGLQLRMANGVTRFSCDAVGSIIQTRKIDD